jgi:hypothetical protein
MPNVQVLNISPNSSNEQFTFIWWLTRAMKASGWRYKASSDGTTKETTGNPSNDKWGAGQQVGSQTGTAAITVTTPTSTQFGGRTTISGMTGANFTTSSVGHFLVLSGMTNSANSGTWLITRFISATSVQVENPAAVAETSAGTASWTEKNALLDTYAASGVPLGAGAWIVLQGPSTIKVPIGTATPAFLKSENVTQSTTGATGEVLGVYTDTVNGGWLVVSPRLSGSGAGVRGWDSAHNITGAISGVAVAPTGTLLEYVREVVFWRSTTTQGHIYFQAIESVTEGTTTATTGRFSTMASLGTATATICPGGASGGSPSTNGFPTVGTYVAGVGTGGSGAVGTGAGSWTNGTSSTTIGLGQIVCASMIEDTNISADGSLALVTGVPATSNIAFSGCGFQRLDDQEDGDLDPFVWFFPFNGANYAQSRTGGNAGTGVTDFWNSTWFQTNTSYYGHRRRGFATGDTFSTFGGALLENAAGNFALNTNLGNRDSVACTFSSTPVPVREPIWVVNDSTVLTKCRKGTLRWIYGVMGGNATDTYDSKRWAQFSSTQVGVVIGPWDGSTNPLNQ